MIALLANQIWCRNKPWYRNRVKIKQLPAARPPQTTRLPQELVEIIISYFIYDIRTLFACSMTCYSWYIAAVPHLHHSLTTDDHASIVACEGSKKYRWPGPLQHSYELGLLPLVRRFRIRLDFYPKNKFTLDDHTLRYFSALTNLQELGIDHLRVSDFMPNIQRYFGHFAPTLRFLALKEPEGSCRQILYFIGLFPNLQDLKLFYERPIEEWESAADGELVPLSVPPLHGRLTLTCFTGRRLVEDMIDLFGGLRFHYMDLFRVKCVQLLLCACAETLETLRLYPTDSFGEETLPEGKERGTSSSLRFIENDGPVYQHFDLSRNKALRALEITAQSMVSADADPSFLRTVLSTITSPLPLDIIIIYRHHDVGSMLLLWETPPVVKFVGGAGGTDPSHQQRFKQLHEMYMVREFRPVFCMDAIDYAAERAVQGLEYVVEMEKVKGGLDYLLHEPFVISEIRSPRTRLRDHQAGGTWRCRVNASAL